MKSGHNFIRRVLGLIFVPLAGIISSCSGVMPALDLPTLIPTEHLPTAIALTSQALIAQEPTAMLPVEVADLTPTFTAVFTSTPAISATATTPSASGADLGTATPPPPFIIPYADIQFISPGELSKVVSPIELRVFLLPGDTGRARVELFGEDGRLMYRKLYVFGSPVNVQTNLRAAIDYEIKGVAETAKLVVSVDDAYGRIKTLVSEDLILLSLGGADINPPGDLLEPIVIQEPSPKVLIQGGSLLVSGLVRTASDQPLLVELVTTDGRVVGNRLAGIAPEPAGGHRLFATEVTYQVPSPTWVRVRVSVRSSQFNGPLQLSSTEVLLAP